MFIMAGLFAIAMGFLEASIVVYLRELYYPNGFDFPLQVVPADILTVELSREICTMVILVTIALIAGKNKLQKFAWFIYCFAVWDIFYYVGLKLFLNWPSSLLTWDLLFMIPVAWVGPVLAPVICSLTMILLAACIVIFQEKGFHVRIKFSEWGLIIGGAVIIFIAFIWDHSRIIIREGLLGEYFNLLNNPRFNQIMAQYKPEYFAWPLFILGEIIILSGITLMVIRTKRTGD
ncbi:MAG: hypothetical protein JSV88_32365 [Candidatus Aminicenantes bacterium]|nr:MAG: hypothetical protein JSV88_32365 [Candidatus Aminicenantes bacterium]